MRRREALAGLLALSASWGAYAQHPERMARVGFLTSNLALRQPFWAPFFAELEKRGWREGVNYSLEAREHLGDYRRALALAEELVALKVDLLVAVTGGAAGAAHAATDKIPVVALLGYPVEAGLAASLGRPGGNITGVAVYGSPEVWGKFIELLRELRPDMRQLAVLSDYAPPLFPDGHVLLPVIQSAASRLHIGMRFSMNRSASEAERALAAIDRDPVDAVIITHGGGVHIRMSSRIAELFKRLRIPAITDVIHPALFEKGNCVLAYSPNTRELLGRLASSVDRVLRGANPSELPFELPSRFDLAINAKAARAIGIDLPPSLLARADKVIE